MDILSYIDKILGRRSVCRYKKETISSAIMEKILEARAQNREANI